MKNLASLLSHLSHALHRDEAVREGVAAAILTATGVTLAPESLSLKDGVLKIEAGATAKNEIRLKEERVKQLFKEKKFPVSRILYN